ncbi:MAG: biotin synthase BioB [Candidatus Omnitrophica bacterium]|nr:biotin synthase BioB [Candidatus Omnitrophota bacterium]
MKALETIINGVLNGNLLSKAHAMELIGLTAEDDILALAHAANTVRKTFTSNTIDFCSLVNAKSGCCSEDCAFCAQSGHYQTEITSYDLLSVNTIVDRAREAERSGAKHFCIVTSGAALNDSEFDQVLKAYKLICAETNLRIDGSLGMLSENKIRRLKEAGIARYNHNLETSERFFPTICTTHSYADRLRTLRTLRQHDIEVCSGGIIGMGEAKEDRVDLALALRAEQVQCIPINILNPRKGTPLENVSRITPLEAIATIAVFRLINPHATIKIAGGREAGLGEYQQLSLEAGGNGFIVGGYLTTPGNIYQDDHAIARRAGYDI